MIPGWIDLQVNGFNGVDFSDENLTLKGVECVSKELFAQGIIGYCPTIITSPLKLYERNLPILAQAIELTEGAQILGVHLEGPFLSPEDGFRGFHPKNCIIPPSIDLYEKFRKWSNDKITIVTLDPSRKGAFDLIRYITKTSRTIVSMGHHSSNRDIVNKAVAAGVKAATHVGNGLSRLIDRFDNPLWPILANDDLFGCFITDGFHLPLDMIKTCLRAKGVKRFIVTSDIVHYAGMKPGRYVFHDGPVIVEASGYIHREGATQLAGSSRTIMECMNVLASLGELTELELYKIGHENPLKLIDAQIQESIAKKHPKIVFRNNQFSLL